MGRKGAELVDVLCGDPPVTLDDELVLQDGALRERDTGRGIGPASLRLERVEREVWCEEGDYELIDGLNLRWYPAEAGCRSPPAGSG